MLVFSCVAQSVFTFSRGKMADPLSLVSVHNRETFVDEGTATAERCFYEDMEVQLWTELEGACMHVPTLGYFQFSC